MLMAGSKLEIVNLQQRISALQCRGPPQPGPQPRPPTPHLYQRISAAGGTARTVELDQAGLAGLVVCAEGGLELAGERVLELGGRDCTGLTVRDFAALYPALLTPVLAVLGGQAGPGPGMTDLKAITNNHVIGNIVISTPQTLT